MLQLRRRSLENVRLYGQKEIDHGSWRQIRYERLQEYLLSNKIMKETPLEISRYLQDCLTENWTVKSAVFAAPMHEPQLPALSAL